VNDDDEKYKIKKITYSYPSG